jgi:galactokinase
LAHRELPDDVMLLAIACHASQSDFSRKYEQVRTASFMGRLLADRIARHDRPKSVSWDGYLSGISADAYVEHFRDRIPTKFKGGDFLEHFGETGDPLTRIEPRTIYKVRSRTEHHIYEHLRARQFYDCLDRACDGDEEALAEAGVLMNASHWSYGQRCGLGCIETDFMVNAIRRQKQPDIFGAKLTGRGGGGFVVVLMRPTDQAFEAIGRATRQYSEKTEKPVTIHRDAVPGAYVTGPVVV